VSWTQKNDIHIYNRDGIEVCQIKPRGRYYRAHYNYRLGLLPAAFDFRDLEITKRTVEQVVESWLHTTHTGENDED